MKKNILALLLYVLCTSSVYTQGISSTPNLVLSSEEYVTGDDGIVRFSINIWGHVPKPGTYLVYDGIDLNTALSFAGGLKEGANYKKVIINSGDTKKVVNISNLSNTANSVSNDVMLKPRDTIIVNQTRSFKFSNQQARVVTVLFQLLNLLYTIDKLN
tara:strand:+ start:410 stop:883 length:474 start_codon:yes stop_codon:yes gene_type:complete